MKFLSRPFLHKEIFSRRFLNFRYKKSPKSLGQNTFLKFYIGKILFGKFEIFEKYAVKAKKKYFFLELQGFSQ